MAAQPECGQHGRGLQFRMIAHIVTALPVTSSREDFSRDGETKIFHGSRDLVLVIRLADSVQDGQISTIREVRLAFVKSYHAVAGTTIF